MNVILVTSFPEKFMADTIRPALAARGVQVLVEALPSRCARVDVKRYAPDPILMMTEHCSHSDSENWSRAARDAGVTIRSLSRKKASWDFLPPPREPDNEPAPMQQPTYPATMADAVPPPVTLEALYEQELTRLKAEIEVLKKRSLDRVLPALMVLIDAGLMSSEEALLKLVDTCK